MRGSCEGLCTLEIELKLCRCRTGVEAANEDSEAALGEDSKDLDSLGLSLCTTETGRLFFQRRAKQLPLAGNVFELSPRGLQPTSNR